MSIQGRAIKKAVLPAVVTTATAWWAAFFIYEMIVYPKWVFGNLGALMAHVTQTWGMILFGAVAGVGAALLLAHKRRQLMHEELAGESLRGLTTSMGKVPIIAAEPSRAPVPPQLAQFGVPGTHASAWMRETMKVSPGHARLMDALLRVLNHDPRLPATHVAGGHGGKTLLEHSLLVVQCMLEMARDWQYEGLKNKKGEVVVGLRNPAYKFNSHDPLLAIVALAHDIGKIECYIKDKQGKVVDTRHAHDVVGARMIARMPEFWGIPKADRDVLTLVVAHYHHPQDLPMHEDGRAIDDRTLAVQELLIKADKAAGKIESGTLYENTMGETQAPAGSPEAAIKVVDGEVLYAAFLEIIHEPGRINGKDSSVRVGQKHAGRVYFAESALRVALIRKLGLSSAPVLGDGRSALTVQLMEMLSERGLLVQEVEGRTYSHKRAMFRVAFFNSKTGKHLADWPAVFIVNPGADLPQISSMADHISRVEITRPVWGETSARGKKGVVPQDEAPVTAPADDETPAAVPAQVQAQAEDTEVEVAEAAPKVTPPVANTPAPAGSDDDFISDLMGVDPLADIVEPEACAPKAPPEDPMEEVQGSPTFAETPAEDRPAQDGHEAPGCDDAPAKDEDQNEFAFEFASAGAEDEVAVPDIPDETEEVSREPAPPADDVESFNKVAKKLGSVKPLKGLEQRHIDRLGEKLQSGMEAALESLEKKASGRPYSRALLLVEKEKLRGHLEAGRVTLYASPKGKLLALEEIISVRGRFDWGEAVNQAEAGEHDIFSVIRRGERIFLRFTEFQD